MSHSKDSFDQGIFEVGDDIGMCFLACCLPPCAMAYARSLFDGSDCFFSYCCMSQPMQRWMIRTGYGIPGDDCTDLALSLCCAPCSTNQILQTVVKSGPIPEGGKQTNLNSWAETGTQAGDCSCGSCCYAFCCNQCAIATSLTRGVGVPFWMGCCCNNLCSARNVLRYQYRIAGADMMDECFVPTCYIGCLGCLGLICLDVTVCCCCCCWPPIIAATITPLIIFTSELLTVTERLGSGENRRYIAGYTPAEGTTSARRTGQSSDNLAKPADVHVEVVTAQPQVTVVKAEIN